MRSIILSILVLICLCASAFAVSSSAPGISVQANISKTSISNNLTIQQDEPLRIINKSLIANITNTTSESPNTFSPIGARSRSVITLNYTGASKISITLGSFDRIVKGPIDSDGIKDGDSDGVMNMIDECPNTPAGALIFDNGCRCKDSENGWEKFVKGEVTWREKIPNLMVSNSDGKNNSQMDYSITNYFAADKCGTAQWSTWIEEAYCNPDYETGKSDEAALSGISYCKFGCDDGICIRPQACSTLGGGNCSDKIQNQDETGIDCGGKCAPCATKCVTGAKYAPQDTPCTSVNGLDPYTVNFTWTDSSDFSHVCWWYEVCHKDLDFIIEEAQRCCSVTSEEGLKAMPDPALCEDALDSSADNCQKCTGMYIVKGMGTYAKWMQGYQEVGELYSNPHPTAETLINHYKIGVCRDYALATETLLRKAGYSQQDVGSTCDGAHCYNVVRFPGDAKWTVVDTTGNAFDVNPGGLPQSGYDYCKNLNESNWCFRVGSSATGYYYTHMIPDVDAYWDIVGSGGNYTYSHATSCQFTRDFAPQCGPGVACGKDSFRIPDFAPSVKDIVGCG